jgi:helicase required for RNAi-mediated heterochromatin assembly 1
MHANGHLLRFPLSNHLVHLNKSIGVPKFVKEQPLVDLTSLRPRKEIEDTPLNIDRFLLEEDHSLDNVDILGPWPKVNDTTLDESQLIALRRIMTKKLAVVQGPPGTGKTYVSLSALFVMLDNLQPGDPPIIVAAQTNHALDQLLKLIAPVEPKFLRLGGRTSEDNVVVKERTLYEIRSKTPTGGGTFRGNYKNAKSGLDASSLEIQLDIQKALTQGDDEAKTFLEWKVITQDQFDSLYDDDWISAQDPELPPGAIALWLGREQLAIPPRCPPVNLAFGDEEDLEFEALEEAEVEIGKKDDDDIDILSGKWFPFRELYTGVASLGYSDKRLQKLLESKSNLWEVSPMIRGEVYRYLKRQLKAKMLEIFRGHMADYHQHARRVKTARWESDALLIKRSRIKLIGCTTTGLSKYRGLLASLQPRTMLIEEAAETLEGTILAGMFASLQQLILVGDHQQLRAHCNVTALEGAPYNLAVSMFERLVSNGIEYTMLNKQRRMISEIRELLDPFYPNLQDHSSVLDRVKIRKPVPGMGGRDSYFFHHQWPESRDDFLSRFNVHEADMVIAFFTYVVLNGIEPSHITILTFYNGQRKVILQKLRRQPELAQYGSKFNVFTVDSYQGEENDVILLSLVRSNIHHNIGFLENKNRAVVSLSRARRGMYIFGNSINLLAANAQSFKLWSTITDRLRLQKHLDVNSGLPIVCQNHHTETVIHEPSDWEKLSGGCRVKCDGQLPCGHLCVYMCHP